ncbi:MAG: hypothetical protein PHE79_09090 [Eubacteriales bacterium]|nr:hypothetical protein [Eubacteriales bacterium]
MRQMNLCIDIDGTVTEPYYWLKRANLYFGKQLQPEDVTAYEIHKLLDIEADDYHEFYQLYGKLLHREAKARFGASEAIQLLYKHHNIHFVTARDEEMRDVSIEWLDRHNMPRDSISLLGSHYKANKARELNSDLFIEDCYGNALQLARSGFEVLLIDCTYNKGLLPENVTRLKSWSEILKIADNKAQIPYSELEMAQ